jgi:hypothetical protein
MIGYLGSFFTASHPPVQVTSPRKLSKSEDLDSLLEQQKQVIKTMQDQIKSMLNERHKVEAEMKAEIYRLRKVFEEISKKKSSTPLIDFKAPNYNTRNSIVGKSQGDRLN